jgi:alkylation response protein AidB-like acyl-CoA dehydrogenase
VRADDVARFLDAYRALLDHTSDPWESAVRGGAIADRLGYAFVAGYEAALTALVPSRDRRTPAALCATETGGAHPRAIATVIEDGALRGEKTFVTLGTHAEELLVLAKTGDDGDHARLALVSVSRDAPGVSVTPLRETPFVPEIPHASLRFDGVREYEALPGDGWTDYVRPFRTIEDAHVHAALLAYLGATGMRCGWPREVAERAASLLASIRTITIADPSSSLTHVALAGAIELSRALVRDAEPHWDRAPDDERMRWRRDRALLEVAAKARAKRLERAWEILSASA